MMTAQLNHIANSAEYMGSAAEALAQEIISVTARRSHCDDEYRVEQLSRHLDYLQSELVNILRDAPQHA